MSKLLSKVRLDPLRGVWGVDALQVLYSDYSFIGVPSKTETEAKPVVDASYNSHSIQLDFIAAVKRTFEPPIRWYFIIWKPYDRAYKKHGKDWYLVKGMASCRRKLKKPEAYLLTREMNAAKVHINGLVATHQNLALLHEKDHCNKYKIYCQQLHTKADVQNVLTYITKEESSRQFIKYLDYTLFIRGI